MKSFFKKFLVFNKNIFFTSIIFGLLFISFGFTQFNLSSAFLNDQVATNSAGLLSLSQSNSLASNKPAGEKLKKFDATGKVVEDEIVVKFKVEITEAEKLSTVAENGTNIDKDLPYAKLKILKVDPARRDEIIQKLKSNPKVEYAGPNYAAYTSVACIPAPNDPKCSDQWHLNKISALPAWNGYKGSSNIKVAVVDTGINYNLLEFGLVGNGGRVIKGRDAFNNDDDPIDDNGHGTNVAGVLGAGTNNGIDVAGVDWAAQIIAVKIGGSDGGTGTAEMAEGLQWLVDTNPAGLKVVNISYYVTSDDPNVTNAVSALISRGILVVVGVYNSSAGNWNCDALPLAKLPGVIAVVGTDGADAHSTGCTNGIQGYLMAAPGQNIWTEYALGGPISVNGTSFAAPQVSAAASILFSCPGNPVLGTVRVALIVGSTDIGMAGYDPVYGYGRLNIYKAMQSLANCTGDTDNDGFADYVENYIGTNPNVKCGINAWPPDFNSDRKVNILDVIMITPPVFGSKFGDASYNKRYDLNPDGRIDIIDITFMTPPYFGTTCTP